MLFHVFFYIKYECISKVNIMFHMASSKDSFTFIQFFMQQSRYICSVAHCEFYFVKTMKLKRKLCVCAFLWLHRHEPATAAAAAHPYRCVGESRREKKTHLTDEDVSVCSSRNNQLYRHVLARRYRKPQTKGTFRFHRK